MGKSTLAFAVVEKLRIDGFQVAFIEPFSPKNMLIDIACQLGIEVQDIKGKLFSAERLRLEIKEYLHKEKAFLIVDNAHTCRRQFQLWLKELLKKKIPIILFATYTPYGSTFNKMLRIKLEPLPESAIYELMKQTALEYKIKLQTSDLAEFQKLVCGNPLLAICAVTQGRLGVEAEIENNQRYLDITPILIVAGIMFLLVRLMMVGKGNPEAYIFAGCFGTLLFSVSYVMQAVPHE
jgi:hypothetical protein